MRFPPLFRRSSSLALHADADEEEAMRQPMKCGDSSQRLRYASLFCGVCDMRVATVLLNAMHIIFTILLEVVDALSWDHKDFHLLAVFAVVLSGLSIFGALNFNFLAMFLSTLGVLVLFFGYLFESHVFGLAMVATILYCQFVLTYEIHSGIMTREKYFEEEFINEEGRQALETTHSMAREVSEVVSPVVRQVSGVFTGEVPLEMTRSSTEKSIPKTAQEEC